MSFKSIVLLFALATCLLAVPVLAQDSVGTKTYKLLRDSDNAADELDLEAENDVEWVRQIEGRDVELSFSLGFLDLNTTLLSHEQIIYKYAADFTYWGDVELTGESTAFAPVLRLGYTFTPWFAVESNASLSFSEYQAAITNTNARKNEPNSPIIEGVTVGEFDPERRSMITFLGGANALLYPLNLIGDNKGLLQPYLTGGYGRLWYDMNSQYSEGPVSTNDFNVGAGLRLIGDKQMSVRFEVLYHMNTVEFDPPTYFQILDEGTTRILLEEHPVIDGVRVDRPVESYASQDINSLNWSIGIQGTF